MKETLIKELYELESAGPRRPMPSGRRKRHTHSNWKSARNWRELCEDHASKLVTLEKEKQNAGWKGEETGSGKRACLTASAAEEA